MGMEKGVANTGSKRTEQKKVENSKIHFHFAFTPHGSWEEQEPFAERIKDADVLVPELMGWQKADQQILQYVSDGTFSPEKAEEVYREYFRLQGHQPKPEDWIKIRGLVQAVAGTKKLIFYADLPSSDTTEALIHEALHTDQGHDLLKQGNLKDAIAAQRTYLQKFAAGQKMREQHIVEQLTVQLPKFLQADGRFRSKAEVRTLVSLGTAHSGITKKMPTGRQEISRSFPGSFHLFPIMEAAARAMDHGKDVPDEEIARVLIAPFITARIRIPEQPHTLRDTIGSLIARRLSLQDIRELTDQAAAMQKPPTEFQFKAMLYQMLDHKGLPAVSTPDDVLNLIRRQFGADSRPAKELTRLLSKNADQATWLQRADWWISKLLNAF